MTARTRAAGRTAKPSAKKDFLQIQLSNQAVDLVIRLLEEAARENNYKIFDMANLILVTNPGTAPAIFEKLKNNPFLYPVIVELASGNPQFMKKFVLPWIRKEGIKDIDIPQDILENPPANRAELGERRRVARIKGDAEHRSSQPACHDDYKMH